MNEQRGQVSTTTLADTQKFSFATGAVLAWCQTDRGNEVSAFVKR